jgi:hypothetical protein
MSFICGVNVAVWRCSGCGHEAASPGPDHPWYGDDRRGDARPSAGRI